MAETNASDLKDRIIETVKADPQLWQEEDREKGFFTVEFGLPENSNFEGLEYPALFVTNAPNFETDKPYGGVITPNQIGTSNHVFQFRLIFFALTSDGQETERTLDTLQAQLKTALKSNIQLRDPKDIDNKATAIAVESFPHTTRSFAVQFEGQDLDGRVITMRVQTVSDLL